MIITALVIIIINDSNKNNNYNNNDNKTTQWKWENRHLTSIYKHRLGHHLLKGKHCTDFSF